jgi:hypothetical protein
MKEASSAKPREHWMDSGAAALRDDSMPHEHNKVPKLWSKAERDGSLGPEFRTPWVEYVTIQLAVGTGLREFVCPWCPSWKGRPLRRLSYFKMHIRRLMHRK